MNKEPSNNTNNQNSNEISITERGAGGENDGISENSNSENDSARVTPWEVEGQIDYDRLVKEFGTQQIGSEIFEQFERIVGEVHQRSPSAGQGN